ncbi:cytochrome c oxidase subunit II [Hyphomicrobium sp. 99]|uniref:cytochrome c oxidase subunit II n=1 Tax=Hyphomicrobium sp. 99 TaxID=1163419 RepID=UPI0005F7B41D|nr:cytochrome c oxidase subunit II [Hyphomicrobium sp. 99]
MDEHELLKTELRWGAVVAAAVALIVAVIIVSSVMLSLHPPSNVEIIDPTALNVSPEFNESNLGSRESPDGSIIVRIIATQFAFVPRCLAVAVGRPVTLRVTSPDVIHGFIIAGTNVNTMVVPGYVSEVHTVFSHAGDHLMPCHEYCGLGHSEMVSTVHVVPATDWQPDAEGRMSCASSK